MARVVLVALAWCAVRGEEYTGGAMPQYGAPGAAASGSLSDDYRGHSPDASAPLDYKYEEDTHDETERPWQYVDVTDQWRKTARKQRPIRYKEEFDQSNDIDADFVPLSRSSRRRLKHRSHAKSGKSRRGSITGHRRSSTAVATYGRGRHDETVSEYLDDIDYRDDGTKYLVDDHVPPRTTTARIIRRKPRDRIFAPPPPISVPTGEPEDEELVAESREKDENKMDTNYWSGEERRIPPPADRMRPVIDTDDSDANSDAAPRLRARQRYNKNYDYNDYYDMKRVKNIKSKLPTLLRRTTTTTRPPLRTSPSELVEALWPARRAGGGALTPRNLTVVTATVVLAPVTTATVATVTVATVTAPTATVAVLDAHATVPANATVLSLAEKSRMSILKKAQMKENVKSSPNKKPPVLLLVTDKLPTVVMVEPPTSGDPWKRAREVEDDSPETLEKVKRMMRLKLVAGAKSIHDLTDDWDEMVCDYIDVALIDAAAAAPPPATAPRHRYSRLCYSILLATGVAFLHYLLNVYL